MSAAAEQTVTLDTAIEQQIALGFTDPHVIYERLEKHFGDALVALARPYLADMVSEMARHRIGQQRRQAIARITPGSIESGDVLLKSLWVPTGDSTQIIYKRIHDMTADDFEARAAFLDNMVVGIRRHAQWCRDCAYAIRTSSVAITAGQLESLPALPSLDELTT